MRKVLSGMLAFSLIFLNASPALAQLGGVTPPAPPPPTPEPVVAPVVQVVTPPADTTGPVISGLANLSLLPTEATLAWTTDEAAVSSLEYGTTQSYGSTATLDATLLLVHTAIILGLTPSTTYYYCIHARDLAGNVTILCSQFVTADAATPAAPVDATPPDITLVTESNITPTYATISFTTTEVSNAQVEYGTTASYGSQTLFDPDLALTHSVNLTGLIPDTTYHYRIVTGDQIGNETIGPDEELTTATLPQVQLVAQMSPNLTFSSIETSSISSDVVTITWQTSLGGDSQVEYGDSENLGLYSTLNSSLATTHSVTLTNLAHGTNYIFRVKSKPLGASVAVVSTNYEFDTLSPSVPIIEPANVTNVASASITVSGAAVSWTTDKPATTQVEYGTDTSYASSTASDLSLSTSHSAMLGGLFLGTTYHYRVKSTDVVGNITESSDYTFTTSGTLQNSGSVTVTLPPASTDESLPSAPPSVVQAEPEDAQVEFSWENPVGENFAETVIVENEEHYPTSPTDGTPVYVGSGDTFTDTGETNGSTNYYALYSVTTSGAYSKPVRIALAPQAGVKEIKFNRSGVLEASFSVEHFTKVYKKGDKDVEVEHLQEVLVAESGLKQENITGYFGNLTESSLKNFQAKHGLAATGIVDVPTQGKLNTIAKSEKHMDVPEDYAVFASDLKQGTKSEPVAALQRYLVYEGSLPADGVTGYFGPQTKDAVAKFQKKYGVVPPAGYVGTKTRHKMRQLSGL